MRARFQTLRADWLFIVSSTVIWVCSLLVTALDFILFQGAVYRFGMANAVGIVLFVAGVVLRRVARWTLAKHYSYGLRTPQKLVKQGIYGSIRHPCYLALLLYGLGTPLVFSSFYGFLVALAFIPAVAYRVRIEEKMLLERFGDEYKEYMRATKRFIPRVF